MRLIHYSLTHILMHFWRGGSGYWSHNKGKVLFWWGNIANLRNHVDTIWECWKDPWLVWWRLRKILEWQVEFHKLHPNEHTERIFQYLVRQLESEQSKLGHFQFSKWIFMPKNHLNFKTNNFLFRISIQKNNF